MAASKSDRPEIDYIIVHFKDRVPMVIDPKVFNCLVWGEEKGKEGYKVLEGFYRDKGETEKADALKKMWEGKPKARGAAAEPKPALLAKDWLCDTTPKS